MVLRRTRLPLVVLMVALVFSATSGTLMAKVKKNSRFSWTGSKAVAGDNCTWWCYYSTKGGSATVDTPEECGALCAINCGGPCDEY